MTRAISLFVILSVWAFAGTAAADDMTAAAEKAQVCTACHGESGNKPIADNPKLAGQSRKYLLYTLRAYKNGNRKDPVMNAQMAPLSDEDLQLLAAYFAAQPGNLLP